VNPEDVAAALDALASRVRRISPPLASNPHRFHEERSDIAKDISDLARSLAPRRPEGRTVRVDVTDARLGRTVTGSMVVNGKRVMVQRRAPFVISSGYQPVKKR
jgi:hypothetical protein